MEHKMYDEFMLATIQESKNILSLKDTREWLDITSSM